jgi:hypothetical protein
MGLFVPVRLLQRLRGALWQRGHIECVPVRMSRIVLLTPPILFRFPLHRRAPPGSSFEPIWRSAGAVGELLRLDTTPSSPSLQA